MHYIVLLVLHDYEKLPQVLDAWEAAGVSGVTVIATSGIGRIREHTMLRDDVPIMPSLNDLLGSQVEELHNRTVFTIVEGEAIIDRVVSATEAVLGDLNKPNNGIIAVLPAARVYGLRPPWKPGDTQE